MKTITKLTIITGISACAGSLLYLAEKGAKSILKKDRIENEDLKDLKVERIQDQNGRMLTAYLSDQSKDTTMVFIHPLNTNGLDMVSYYEFFKDRIDANFLLIDLAGQGQSEGKNIAFDDSYEDDLISWIYYLKRNDVKNIILYGKEFGANILLKSLNMLESYPEVKCIISDGATSSNEEYIQDSLHLFSPLNIVVGGLTKVLLRFKYKVPFKKANIINKLGNYDRPILFIQSRKDKKVKMKRVFNLYNAKKDHKDLMLIKNKAYLYQDDETNPYYDMMIHFIKDSLN